MNTTPSEGAPEDPTMIDCASAVAKLWDYLDGNLGTDDREAVRQHVQRCSHCFPHAEFGQVMIDAVSQARRLMPDGPSLRASVLDRLKAEGYEEP